MKVIGSESSYKQNAALETLQIQDAAEGEGAPSARPRALLVAFMTGSGLLYTIAV
jgi:hypothetical protein